MGVNVWVTGRVGLAEGVSVGVRVKVTGVVAVGVNVSVTGVVGLAEGVSVGVRVKVTGVVAVGVSVTGTVGVKEKVAEGVAPDGGVEVG